MRSARETVWTPNTPSMPSRTDGVFAFRLALESLGANVTVLPDGCTWAIQFLPSSDTAPLIERLINENDHKYANKENR